jgi:hypothetical protein
MMRTLGAQSDSPVAPILKRRLSAAASRLGTSDPADTLGSLLDLSFALPNGDARYARNSYAPGWLPLEYSFSEASPCALRLTFEPFGPEADPLSRRSLTTKAIRELIGPAFGRRVLRQFDQFSEPWRADGIRDAARFGAFLGAAFDASGVEELKAYYELHPGDREALPVWSLLRTAVWEALPPGTTPLLQSVACRRNGASVRLYLACRDGLRLLDLEPLMSRGEIGHRVPDLLSTTLAFVGGYFSLPGDCVVIGLREAPDGLELKLEILPGALPTIQERIREETETQLAARPRSLRAFRRWIGALTPDGCRSTGEISVISIRVSPHSPAQLNVYVRPAGYALVGN